MCPAPDLNVISGAFFSFQVRDGAGMGSKYTKTQTNPQHSSYEATVSTSKAKVYDP